MDRRRAGSRADRPLNATLTATLEAALARELRATWRQLNDAYFRSALLAPTLELVALRATLGRWIPATRTMEISLPLVIEQPWGAVVEVLKHEMAHQYVHEVLRETSETPHGPAFRDVCARLGVDPRAAGMPSPDSVASSDPAHADAGEDKTVVRISRLLALAESPNQHEAEAAMAAAQRLMLKHNLDVVRTQTARAYGFVHLGRPTGRVGEHERLVAMILGKHFFVEAIWVPVYRPREGKRGSLLEICGTSSNLAIAEYAHGFLHGTAERLWNDHKQAQGLGDRERRTFLAGVMTGFADKLARQEATSRADGLVWVKDGDLGGFLRRRHPHVRHVRHAGQQRNDTWVHGREAGRKIVLHRPVTAGPASRGHVLPARKPERG
jgi:predicted SprT family Zn-dependent metalloprotease